MILTQSTEVSGQVTPFAAGNGSGQEVYADPGEYPQRDCGNPGGWCTDADGGQREEFFPVVGSKLILRQLGGRRMCHAWPVIWRRKIAARDGVG